MDRKLKSNNANLKLYFRIKREGEAGEGRWFSVLFMVKVKFIYYIDRNLLTLISSATFLVDRRIGMGISGWRVCLLALNIFSSQSVNAIVAVLLVSADTL